MLWEGEGRRSVVEGEEEGCGGRKGMRSVMGGGDRVRWRGREEGWEGM